MYLNSTLDTSGIIFMHSLRKDILNLLEKEDLMNSITALAWPKMKGRI